MYDQGFFIQFSEIKSWTEFFFFERELGGRGVEGEIKIIFNHLKHILLLKNFKFDIFNCLQRSDYYTTHFLKKRCKTRMSRRFMSRGFSMNVMSPFPQVHNWKVSTVFPQYCPQWKCF